ncbi:MAG TPA: ABC transporter substrate-binding protein [bacterium]|nr:ABC transporter substrate-binding protein [bacterium]
MAGWRGKIWSRRDVLGSLSLAGAAALTGLGPKPGTAEPPPETKTIRLVFDPVWSGLCYAPLMVAASLFRGEGFTDVRYVKMVKGTTIEVHTLAAGAADMAAIFPTDLINAVDAGVPFVTLMAVNGPCLELVGTEHVRTLSDLKAKTVTAAAVMKDAEAAFLANMLAYAGMDPRKDVHWVVNEPDKSMRLLAEGKVDAFIAVPPAPQQMRARKIGHVVLSTATDRPWSQYACCMAVARREFVQRYPVATKRALRAIAKAVQLCTSEPKRSARFLIDKKFNLGASYDETLQTLKDVPYAAIWRDYDPEASLLAHALLMHEIGFIKKTPQQIIAQGTDWRFLNELKKELKA